MLVEDLLRELADLISRCYTVRGCALPWYIFSRLLSDKVFCERGGGSHCLKFFEPGPLKAEMSRDVFVSFLTNLKEARHNELALKLWQVPPSPGEMAARKPLRSEETGVHLVATGDGYATRPDIAPFIQQIRCYSERHGFKLIVDDHEYHKAAFVKKFGSDAIYAFPGRGTSVLHEQVQQAMDRGSLDALRQIARSDALLTFSDTANLATWAMPYGIGRYLENHDLVIGLNVDVTIRPDAYDINIVRELQLHSERQGIVHGHHVYLKDMSPYTKGDCYNTGFVAIRNTPVGRLMMEIWREKLQWPGLAYGEMGAFAESVLELLFLERARQNKKAENYISGCAGLLFPSEKGVTQWHSYCECWQNALLKLAGTYRHRRSQFVGFIDPERLDVNFVPHTAFPHHQGMLEHLRLCPGGGRQLGPFLVHWAGLGTGWERHARMKAYLRCFNASDAWDPCSLELRAAERPAKRRHFGTPPIPDASTRIWDCTKSLKAESDRRNIGADGTPTIELFGDDLSLSEDDFRSWWFGVSGCNALFPTIEWLQRKA